MDYIFSFSSRNNAFRFAEAVEKAGAYAKLINSPIKSGSGCGLAVKCYDYDLCSDILNYGYYASLRAVYSFDGYNYQTLYSAGN